MYTQPGRELIGRKRNRERGLVFRSLQGRVLDKEKKRKEKRKRVFFRERFLGSSPPLPPFSSVPKGRIRVRGVAQPGRVDRYSTWQPWWRVVREGRRIEMRRKNQKRWERERAAFLKYLASVSLSSLLFSLLPSNLTPRHPVGRQRPVVVPSSAQHSRVCFEKRERERFRSGFLFPLLLRSSPAVENSKKNEMNTFSSCFSPSPPTASSPVCSLRPPYLDLEMPPAQSARLTAAEVHEGSAVTR